MENTPIEEPKYIVTIGASAGGLHSVIELLNNMTEEMSAAIFIVLHTSNMAYTDAIVSRLQNNTVFTCKMAEHEEPIRSRFVYFAVPDQHLLLKRGTVLLGKGAEENRWRPAIDVLFRSAAVAYNSRVIGVILTGLLEDGTAGMQFIKRCGGTCIVQDPDEAEYPDMPKSVLRYVKVDYCTTLERIGIIIKEMARNGMPAEAKVPEELQKEAALAERIAIEMDNMDRLGGNLSGFSCPDCGGALWELNQGGLTRYRCYTGHMFTGDELQESKRKELETTFWVALRILEERRNLLLRMSEEEERKGWVRSAANKARRADELQVHIGRIKDLLFASTDDPEPTWLELDKQ